MEYIKNIIDFLAFIMLTILLMLLFIILIIEDYQNNINSKLKENK